MQRGGKKGKRNSITAMCGSPDYHCSTFDRGTVAPLAKLDQHKRKTHLLLLRNVPPVDCNRWMICYMLSVWVCMLTSGWGDVQLGGMGTVKRISFMFYFGNISIVVTLMWLDRQYTVNNKICISRLALWKRQTEGVSLLCDLTRWQIH